MKISLCMIVKDEEEVLARCLESAAPLVEEIVIVDTGSTDSTVEIAKHFSARVLHAVWQDDFALARNASFAAASGDYILWLDADDVVTEENAKRFLLLKKELEESQADMVMCPYETGGIVFLRERIVKRCDDMEWQGHVHECIPPHGEIAYSDFTVSHLGSSKEKGMRNLHIYQKWAAQETLSGRDLFYYGRELYYHRLYTEAEAVLEKMLRSDGWHVNKIEACKILAACYSETGAYEEALSTLFRSFHYGEPRASVLCEIGTIFKGQKRYREAIYWFESALYARDHSREGDFEQPDCRSITPLLELVYLYHALGEYDRSLEYHKKSEAIAPDHLSVIFNKNYFGV